MMKLLMVCLLLHFNAEVFGQTAGTNSICVPAGTCITGTGGGVIDPRIVVPGTTSAPATCSSTQQSCLGSASAVACGQRYVTNVPTAAGPTVRGAYPWQAFITVQNNYVGSGVLIDSYHVLTVAHKFQSIATSTIQVYMGVFDASGRTQAQVRNVATAIIHPSYNSATLNNDIAVLTLSAPIALGYQNNIGTACLPAAGTSYVGRRCMISGWGASSYTASDAGTSVQKQVDVPIVSYATCRSSMLNPSVLGTNTDQYLDPNTELCAGGEPGKDACSQDGGAPLVCTNSNNRFEVAGLVSWGKNCGQSGVYGVYVNVSNYNSWITTTILSRKTG